MSLLFNPLKPNLTSTASDPKNTKSSHNTTGANAKRHSHYYFSVLNNAGNNVQKESTVTRAEPKTPPIFVQNVTNYPSMVNNINNSN